MLSSYIEGLPTAISVIVIIIVIKVAQKRVRYQPYLFLKSGPDMDWSDINHIYFTRS